MTSTTVPTDADLRKEWRANESRPVLLIDETREDLPPNRQYIAFMAVVSNAGAVLAAENAIAMARGTLAKQAQKVRFKGSRLFGGRKKRSHEAVREAALAAIKSAQAISIIMTTSDGVTDAFATTPGKVEAVKPTGERQVLAGRELMPVLTFVKKIATDLAFGAQQVDVILDRSSALGLDPAQVGISGKTQFQVLGPSSLQQAVGQETSPICPSSFQIISTSDDGPFSDLLLLPDTVGYLGFLLGGFATAKSRVVNGDPFWMWYADMDEFRRSVPHGL